MGGTLFWGVLIHSAPLVPFGFVGGGFHGWIHGVGDSLCRRVGYGSFGVYYVLPSGGWAFVILCCLVGGTVRPLCLVSAHHLCSLGEDFHDTVFHS